MSDYLFNEGWQVCAEKLVRKIVTEKEEYSFEYNNIKMKLVPVGGLTIEVHIDGQQQLPVTSGNQLLERLCDDLGGGGCSDQKWFWFVDELMRDFCGDEAYGAER